MKSRSFISAGFSKNFSSIRAEKKIIGRKMYQPIQLTNPHHKYSKSMASSKSTPNFYTRMRKGARLDNRKDSSPYNNSKNLVINPYDRNSMKIDEVRKMVDTSIESNNNFTLS